MAREKSFNNKLNTRRRASTERGQGLVEYALGLVLVGMVASVSLVAVGPAISDAFCDTIETFNPALSDQCGGEGTGVTVLYAKYNAGKSELDVQAKASPDCDYDLQVGYGGTVVGTMERQGESFVFKHTETLFPPPTSVDVGHPECGWVSVPVG